MTISIPSPPAAKSRWWNVAVVTVPALIGAGTLVGYLSNSGVANEWYRTLARPTFQPPPWVFGAVWTALYASMGVALAMVTSAPASRSRTLALRWFSVQLALNLLWSPLFFGLGAIELALLEMLALIASVVFTARRFGLVRPAAGALFIPYLLWLGVAFALNLETARLNPGAGALALGLFR